jgi:transposase
MRIRIQVSTATVQALHTRLQQAYQHDEGRVVRRTTVLLDLLVHHVPVEGLCAPWGLSPACLYGWRQAVLRRGMDSLVSRQGGGRRPKLTAQQKQRLVELREAGPLVVGCETAWWTSVRIRVLIWRAFGVLYNCQDGCPLLHHLGFSLHKARLVSDHRDTATRLAWLGEQWPAMCRAAQGGHGLILGEDEASCAQWGSWSSTWARRGQQPEVTTSGKRKGDKVCGAMAYVSGRLCSQGIEGRLASDSSQGFWRMILAHTTAHLCLIHDGARYHTSQATQQCLETHRERITASPLPS